MKRVWIAAGVLCLAASCATSSLPRANTRAHVRRYVEDAASVVGSRGAAACEVLATETWRDERYYVFVTNADTHVTVCHPAVPAAVGRNDYDLQDVNGKYFMREMLEIAKKPGKGGWVEYMWPATQGGAPALKSTYVVGVAGPDGTRYVVGSGSYDLVQ